MLSNLPRWIATRQINFVDVVVLSQPTNVTTVGRTNIDVTYYQRYCASSILKFPKKILYWQLISIFDRSLGSIAVNCSEPIVVTSRFTLFHVY